MAVYRLDLITNHGDRHVAGPEDSMRGQFAEVKKALEATDGVGPRIIELMGWCYDTPDRADIVIMSRVEDIQGAALVYLGGI